MYKRQVQLDGNRSQLHLWNQNAGELQCAVYQQGYQRVLESLAHDTVVLVQRFSVFESDDEPCQKQKNQKQDGDRFGGIYDKYVCYGCMART